jgi:hypothetical protein
MAATTERSHTRYSGIEYAEIVCSGDYWDLIIDLNL